MEEMPLIRSLGDLEYTYWLMGLASCTQFVVRAQLSGEVSEGALSSALQAVQMRHPLLQAAIRPHPKHGAVFVPCKNPISMEKKKADLEVDRLGGPGGQVIAAMEDQKLIPLNHESGPLARACLLEHGQGKKSLLVTFHHAAADGICAARFVLDVLEAAQKISQGSRPRMGRIPEKGPFESLINKKNQGAWALTKAMWYSNWINIHRIFARPRHLPQNRHAWPHERKDLLVSAVVDRDLLKKIHKRARKKECSLHAVLCAAQLRAMAGQYPEKEAVRVWLLSLVDLRRRVDPVVDPQVMNMMISMAESCFKVAKEENFWDLAARVGHKVNNRLESDFPFWYLPWQAKLIRKLPGLHKPDKDGSAKIMRMGQRTRPLVSPVSNIGRVEGPEDFGSFKLEALHFSLPLSSSGLFGSSATGFGGRIYWDFSFAEPCVTREQAGNLAREALRQLEWSLG